VIPLLIQNSKPKMVGGRTQKYTKPSTEPWKQSKASGMRSLNTST